MAEAREKRAENISAELKRILEPDSDFILNGPEEIDLKDFIAITKQWDTDVPAIHTLLALYAEKCNYYATEWLEIMLRDFVDEAAPLFAGCIDDCDYNACDFIKECFKISQDKKLRENIFKVFDTLLWKDHIGNTVKGLFKEVVEDVGMGAFDVCQYFKKLLEKNNPFALGFLADQWDEHGIDVIVGYVEDLVAKNKFIQELVERKINDGDEEAEKIFKDALGKDQSWAVIRAKKEMRQGSRTGKELFYEAIMDGDREALEMLEKYLHDLDLYGHTETPEWSEIITKLFREGRFQIIEIVKRAVINNNKTAIAILDGLIRENNFFAIRVGQSLEDSHAIKLPALQRQLSLRL